MSLLMQALKKAERARQSGLQEEEIPDDEYDRPVTPAEPAPPALAERQSGPPPGPRELSLEPLDDRPESPARSEPPQPPPPPSQPQPPIEPAVEAAHNPVPPQARHEGTRTRPASDEIPVSNAGTMPPPDGVQPDRRGPGAMERRAMPRTAPARGDTASGIDMARLRVAGLSGLLVLVAGTFGYLYWQGVRGPGPGASLPMVPMPPPSATGATSADGAGGIVVVPAGPPFDPLGTSGAAADAPPAAVAADVIAAAPAATPAAVPAATPPAVPTAQVNTGAAPAGAAPRTGRTRTPPPTAAQLASIEDPEVRRVAMRDAMERAERDARSESPATIPAPAVASAGSDAAAAAATAATAAPVPASVVAAAGMADVQVSRGAQPPTISPAVQAGYAAFVAGNLAAAREQYAAALRSDPNSRDALLGSAAIAARERRDDDAARYYGRLLAMNPRDADAIAGLAALRTDDGDRTEIRLKGVLRNDPDAASVRFALGNLYARQGRWQEAQQAYFRAWTAAPANADYAFNLAVGLDRLNQGRLAREYYQRALALASASPAAFDRAAVQRRLRELPGTPPAAPAPAGN